MRGQGCPSCNSSNKLNNVTFIEKCNLLHNGKYDYSLVEYVNSKSKIKIICKEHGIFEQFARNHLAGYGCSICSGNKKSTKSEFIEKSNFIHDDRYDYSLVEYKGALKKIKIICNEHGIFEQTPNKHLNGRVCQTCGLKYGLMENNWLNNIGINKKNRQVKIGKYIVDGFDPLTNTIYEFNGDFWHGNPSKYNPSDINYVNNMKFGDLYEKTVVKENYLRSLGYNVVSIWESDFNK